MAKGKPQKSPTRKASKTVETIEEAIAVYGGKRAMANAFNYRSSRFIDEWLHQGFVPRGHELGLYLGLKKRGYSASPKLMGVDRWRDLPGARP